MLLPSNEFEGMVTWYVLCIWNYVCMSLAGIYLFVVLDLKSRKNSY